MVQRDLFTGNAKRETSHYGECRRSGYFPNQKLQNGRVWHLRTIQEIRLDPGIPEELKDVTEVLDTLPPRDVGTDMESCSLRSVLLHKDFRTEGVNGIPVYEWSRLANYLTTKTNENFAVRDYFIKRSEYLDRWKRHGCKWRPVGRTARCTI